VTRAFRLLALVAAVLAAAPSGAVDPGERADVRTVFPTTTERPQPPAMTLPGLDGNRHSLADWRGKIIVLNFWAAWCAPCQAEIPDFVASQERYASRGLQVVGIGIDAEKPLRNVQRTLEMNYPVLVADPAGHRSLLQQWGNGSGVIPYTVVIDRKGRVAYTHRGPMEHGDLDAIVLPLLD
jgi:peroxiredoxin